MLNSKQRHSGKGGNDEWNQFFQYFLCHAWSKAKWAPSEHQEQQLRPVPDASALPKVQKE
jgi:hypothetical protein